MDELCLTVPCPEWNLALGKLPLVGDSQFSYYLPLLAWVILTQRDSTDIYYAP